MIRMLAIALVALGLVGLLFGGLAYRQHHEDVRFGDLVVEHTERRSFPIPPWAAASALVIGAMLFAMPTRDPRSHH